MATVQAPGGPVHLRRAVPDDARGIATVHVQTWQEAYRGLVPAPVLEHLNIGSREGFWREAVSGAPPDRRPWVAEAEGRAVGFVSCGMSRDDDASSSTGEIYALYVCPGYWRMGTGRLLVEHAYRDLRAHGFLSATAWVLAADHSARAFFERLGWRLDGRTRTDTMADAGLEEVRYRRVLQGTLA